MTIPITKVLFGEEELRAVQLPLETGWVVQGPYVKKFEDDFAAITGAGAAVATSSCTTALHIAVAALGLKPGDEVIVPSFTWVATANVVEYLGATPVFCDIDLASFNLDTTRLAGLVTPRTVGIIPVHLFGGAADMDPVLELARRHQLWVVEDAACGFGTWYAGRHAGTFAEAGCFSFHPRKSITTGEGGMITTADPELERLSRSLRDHGASRSDHDRHHSRGSFLLSNYDVLGFNFRMTDIQGALGCAQLDRAQMILAGRRARAARYDELLAGLDWFRPQRIPAGSIHGYQAYVGVYAPEEPTLGNLAALNDRRNALMARLESQGIATRPGTHAPPLQGLYREKYGFRPGDFPAAAIAEQVSLALPLFPQMTDTEQDTVCEALVAAHAA